MSLLEAYNHVLASESSLRTQLSNEQEAQFSELLSHFERGAWSRSAAKEWLQSLRLFTRCSSAELIIINKRHPNRNQRISTRESQSIFRAPTKFLKLFQTPTIKALDFNTLRVCTYANNTEHSLGFSSLSLLLRAKYLLTEVTDICTISFVGADASRVVLTLKRRKQVGPFNDIDIRTLDRIALTLKQSFNRFIAQTKGFNGKDRFGEFVNSRSKPCAVVLSDGTIESANESFINLGRKLQIFKIEFETQELVFISDRFTNKFKAAITQFLAEDTTDTPLTRLYLNTTKLPLIWAVEKFECPQSKVNAALITINDPNERPNVTADDITYMIRATRAEARICWSLLHNPSLAVAAEYINISVEQAQTCLNSVLKRNGFKNANELIMRLNKLVI